MFLLICTSLINIVKHLKYRYCMQFFEKDTLYSKIFALPDFHGISQPVSICKKLYSAKYYHY